MKFSIEKVSLSKATADVLVVGVFQEEKPADVLKELDPKFPPLFRKEIQALCTAEGFTGKGSQTLPLPTYGQIASRKLIIRGLGKKAEYNATGARKAAAAMARRLGADSHFESISFELRLDHPRSVQAVIEGWILGAYTFNKYKTKKSEQKKGKPPGAIRIASPDLTEKEFAKLVERGQSIAEATNFARDLVAEPAAYMTPTKLAEAAQELASSSLTCEVLDAKAAEKLGMGAFLGVARGAKEPPKFIVLHYTTPGATRSAALVGKGITFDSGGLSIKTAQGMETMKYDMSGAAVVIGTMKALAALKPEIEVWGVIAATENMPGDNAMHPGDIVTALNGKTIEVNNTDAEGRLVLADALSYISKQKPGEIIDVATLTGAVVTALGRAAAGIMGNDDHLVQRLISAGSEAGEKLWQLPLFDEYKESLKSDIADLKNAGAKGEAPSSCAAMFLKEFVDGRPWAHIDIAGPAWADKDKDELNKGGTAFGVRTLCYYLLNDAKPSKKASKR